MPVITCPSCTNRLRVAPEKLGKLLRCPHCGETFTAALDVPAAPAAPVAPGVPGAAPVPGASAPPAPAPSAAGPYDWLPAMLVGAAAGAICGVVVYAILGLLAGAIWGEGSPLASAVVAAIVGGIYYAVVGLTIGIVVGLTRNQMAGYLVAIGFALVGMFFLRGGACSAILTMGFAWVTITAVRARLEM